LKKHKEEITMKLLAAVLCIVIVAGCSTLQPMPSPEFCRLERLTANPQPCIPHVCYGYEWCIGEVAWLFI